MVMSEIVLAAHKDNRKTLAEMEYFRDPLRSSLLAYVRPVHVCNDVSPSPGRCQGNQESR
jgi:hypothetical protein